MYEQVIERIKELGKTLPPIAGNIKDIGVKKRELTEKDLEIERSLSELVSTFPGEHSVYAEELHEDYLEAENVWVIDPISNTFNFIHGLPHYSVSLAHVKNGEIIFATVYDPSVDELFTAKKGKGTFLNGSKVKVTDNESDLTILGGSHFTPGKTHRAHVMLKINEEVLFKKELGTLRILGSLAVHYAYVACGRADVAISLNKDTFPEFAGKLLVEESGGRFTDFTGKELDTDTKTVLATNGKVHGTLVDYLNEYDVDIRSKL